MPTDPRFRDQIYLDPANANVYCWDGSDRIRLLCVDSGEQIDTLLTEPGDRFAALNRCSADARQRG